AVDPRVRRPARSRRRPDRLDLSDPVRGDAGLCTEGTLERADLSGAPWQDERLDRRRSHPRASQAAGSAIIEHQNQISGQSMANEPEPWKDIFFSARDGLRLYARHYPAPGSRLRPVLCLAGLTRNSRDFHALAVALSTGEAARDV